MDGVGCTWPLPATTPESGAPVVCPGGWATAACMGGGCGPGLVAIDGELERRRSSTRPAAGGKGVAGCCRVPAIFTAAVVSRWRRSRLLRLVCCAGLAARRCSPVITGLPPHIKGFGIVLLAVTYLGAQVLTRMAQQAGRDIAGDRRLCSGCAYHGCGDSEPRRPSDPVADTIATHPRCWAFRDTGPGR
ncbi:unnamed protein product [Lampetra planeri]